MKFLQSKYIFVTIILSALLILSIIFAVTFGTVKIPAHQVYEVILHRFTKSVSDIPAKIYDVVWYIRLPRLILALIVGMGLSISGLTMQAVVRNPLADPYTIGISSGAYLGAALAVILQIGSGVGRNFVGIMAFIGSLAVSFIVLILSQIGGKITTTKLLLSGTAVSSLCTAIANFIIFRSQASDRVQTITNWIMGSFAAANWSDNIVILFVILIGTLFLWTQHRNLNLMLLGEDSAITLGVDLHFYRVIYMIVCALLVAFSVYSAGMIGFVGLLIPHISRLLFGVDHKKLIPITALLGAIFLVWADVVCRTVIPKSELPVGILTAIMGAPCFLYLMIKKEYGFGGNS